MSINIMSEEVPPSPCPGCGEVWDGATGNSTCGVREGDLSLCIKCGTLSEYTAAKTLVAFAPEKFDLLPPKTQAEVMVMKAMIARRKEEQCQLYQVHPLQ